MSEVSCIADSRCLLGEGILWEPRRRRLFWFDIARSQMLSCDTAGGDLRCVDLSKRVSAAVLAGDGGFVAAADTGVGHLDPDSGVFSRWREVEPGEAGNRTNDGRGDPRGAFWFGTMNFDEHTPSGAIYRLAPDGRVHKVVGDVVVPNAIAFAPCGGHMYWTDSPKKVIWRCALSEQGEISERRVFVSLEGKPQSPDGAVVDAEGFLWNAEWDGWRVVRYDPDGAVERVVPVPVARPTCPVVAGDDAPAVFVSSARQGLAASALKKQPQAGGVFSFEAPAPAAPPPLFSAPL